MLKGGISGRSAKGKRIHTRAIHSIDTDIKLLWSTYQTIQENMLKGGISGRSAKGKRIHTRAIHSIDTDIKLNRALWVMAETLLESQR